MKTRQGVSDFVNITEVINGNATVDTIAGS